MIDFMRHRWLYFSLSTLVILPGLFSLARWRLNPAIDFTGGTTWEIQFTAGEPTPITADQLLELVASKEVNVVNIETKPEEQFAIKTQPLDQEKKEELNNALKEGLKDFTEISYETVGPTLGRELLVKTITGIGLAAVLILFYVTVRFGNRMYGISAILAMLHDSLVILGVFSLLGHFSGVEVDTLFVTAVLTILSFSVHDTIVVYDRIRELSRKNPKKRLYDIVNRAVNETLTRSLNNSLTIIFMLLALALMGGVSIRWFVIALLVGTISGTYSSTFTAAPLLVAWNNWREGRSTTNSSKAKPK